MSIEALRTALTQFSQRHSLERARTIISQVGGATTVSGVPAARRQAVIDALNAPLEAPAVA